MKIVTQNTVCFLENFGKFSRQLGPGLNLYIPFIQTVSPSISLMEQISPVAHQKVITKDNVEIDVDGYFFYKVVDPLKAYYSIENFEDAISGLSTSVSRSEIGKSTLDEIFQQREQLNERIKIALNESTNGWGIECLNYEMIKIEPPSTIRNSLLEVASAERTRRKEVILSEAEREFQERVSVAKRDAEIVVQTAEWEGTCIWNDEYKKALNELEEALGNSKDKDRIINYILIEEYLGKMKKILQSKNVYVLPQGNGEKGSDNFMMFSAVLSQMSQLQMNKGLDSSEVVEKIKNATFAEIERIRRAEEKRLEKLQQGEALEASELQEAVQKHNTQSSMNY